jgi:hypothetical protein
MRLSWKNIALLFVVALVNGMVKGEVYPATALLQKMYQEKTQAPICLAWLVAGRKNDGAL